MKFGLGILNPKPRDRRILLRTQEVLHHMNQDEDSFGLKQRLIAGTHRLGNMAAAMHIDAKKAQ